MMNEQWLQLLQKEIEEFKETIQQFDRGEMDRKTYKGTSGGLGSYAQKDPSKHMLRLRMPGGRMTKERLSTVAEMVKEYQVEKIKLTTCETVQLHQLSASQVPAMMEKAAKAGIYCRGGGGDNPRNVMCSPLSGVQEGEAFDVMPYAEAATVYLLSICREIHMPRKLKLGFSNGAEDSVHTAFRDMGFMAQPDGTFSLRIAGGLGANHKMGILVEEHVKPEEILYYVKAMVTTFCEHGNYTNRAKARTRYMQETLGEDGLRKAYLANVKRAKEVGGLELTVTGSRVNKAGDGTISNPRAIAQKQPGLYAVSYHPIGGIMPVEKPGILSRLIDGMDQVECRIAPNETIYIINLTAKEAGQILKATEDGANTRFEHSVSCIGGAICQQGVRNSQAVLKASVDAVREAKIPDGVLPPIAVSGCPSSCSGHQAAAIGFQGAAKFVDKKPMSAFFMYLGGTDQIGAAKFGESKALILEEDVPKLLVEMGQAAASRGLTWEEWSSSFADEMQAIIKKYE